MRKHNLVYTNRREAITLQIHECFVGKFLMAVKNCGLTNFCFLKNTIAIVINFVDRVWKPTSRWSFFWCGTWHLTKFWNIYLENTIKYHVRHFFTILLKSFYQRGLGALKLVKLFTLVICSTRKCTNKRCGFDFLTHTHAPAHLKKKKTNESSRFA